MREKTAPRINNVKLHILLTEDGIEILKTSLLKIEKKSFNNFCVVKNGFTYIIFSNKGFVNITGIRGFSQLVDVVPHFCEVFNLKPSHISSDIVIDNISAAGNFHQRVNLEALWKQVGETFCVRYNRDRFPGAFCKKKKFGTLTLFPSGLYVIVGCKSATHVQAIYLEMLAFIPTLSSTQKTRVCALPVD